MAREKILERPPETTLLLSSIPDRMTVRSPCFDSKPRCQSGLSILPDLRRSDNGIHARNHSETTARKACHHAPGDRPTGQNTRRDSIRCGAVRPRPREAERISRRTLTAPSTQDGRPSPFATLWPGSAHPYAPAALFTQSPSAPAGSGDYGLLSAFGLRPVLDPKARDASRSGGNRARLRHAPVW